MSSAELSELMNGAPHRPLTEADIDAMAWDHDLDEAAALETCDGSDYDGDDDLAGLCL